MRGIEQGGGREGGSCSIYYVHSIAAPCKAVQVCACVNLFTVLIQPATESETERERAPKLCNARDSHEILCEMRDLQIIYITIEHSTN